MVNLADFRRHVKEKSPAFVPLFKDNSRYQVAWGGAGCVHPETKIHTEFGLMRICDINRPMRVLSWNEKSQKFQLSLSGGSFPKGRANLYRIVTQRGEFRASGHHLVLLSTGEYRRVDELKTYDEISQANATPLSTIEESCLKLSEKDAPRYSQKALDYLGDYANECRRYDPLPHEEGDYAIFSEPSQGDALKCDHSCLTSPCIEQGKSQSHNHLCLCGDRICKTYCDEMEQQTESGGASHSEASSFEYTSGSRLECQLSRQTNGHHRTAEQSYQNELWRRDSSGDSYKPPTVNDSSILSRSTHILSIDKVELSEYWCMQVLDTNNYVSEDGAIHHNSGKSHIVARKILYRTVKEIEKPHKFLIVRKVNRTIKRSVFTLFRNLISLWGLYDEFDVNLTDLTITYKKNGAQLMFTGMDDPEKLKSIEGVTGVWMEEATEFTQEDFEQLDLRLRGETLYAKQIMLTLNPISEQHWIKRVFFDDPIDGCFTLKTTYLDNAFIDADYKMVMENKKKTNPRYYNTYALGNWGTAEGLVFNNVEHRAFKLEDVWHLDCVQGGDFGFVNDPTAFNQTYVDMQNKTIYVYDGFYEKGMSNEQIAERIKEMQAHKHNTTFDSAEPKSISRLQTLGIKCSPAQKGKDSINAGIDFLLEFKIVVNAHLVEFMTEFNNYCWDVDKEGKQLNKPVDDFNHFIDSLRYAMEKYSKPQATIRVGRRRR